MKRALKLLVAILVLVVLVLGYFLFRGVWRSWFPAETTPEPVADQDIVQTDTQTPEIVLPDNFVDFGDQELGAEFSYPVDWGTVQKADPTTGITELTFSSSVALEDQEENAVFLPTVTLVAHDYKPDAERPVFTNFQVNAADDCDNLLKESAQIIADYAKRSDGKPELIELQQKNKFFCRATSFSGLEADVLISYVPLQIEVPQGQENGLPIPVPVLEYRFEFPDGRAYQSLIASLFIFSDKPGTTYQDYKDGSLDAARQQAISDFETMMATVKITKEDPAKVIDQILDNQGTARPATKPADESSRARPTSASHLQTYRDHDLIQFDYPNTWQVEKEAENVLKVGTPKLLASNDAPQVRIKILANPESKSLDDFLRDNSQVILNSVQNTEIVNYGDTEWRVFRNFQGVYKLDIYFAKVGNKVIEINALASGENGYDPLINNVIRSLHTK